jgi:ABC-type lipoprotein export system ATPase subunit
MVTHDLEVASHADRIIHMRDGSIQGTETKRKPEVAA